MRWAVIPVVMLAVGLSCNPPAVEEDSVPGSEVEAPENLVSIDGGNSPEAEENDYLQVFPPAREWNPEGEMAEVPHQYETVRDAWMVEEVGPRLDMLARITRYVRAMGFKDISDAEIRDFCSLAWSGGYDPRLWAAIAVAESSGGRGSDNYYGFCGSSGPWARPYGGWREQTYYLHDRIVNFYAQYVDIGVPENVLYFHHEGEAPQGDPCEVFYVRNVASWIRGM